MFQKLHFKLAFICCIITAIIVFVIIVCCLSISEKNMFGQEQAMFSMRANAITSDLYNAPNITMDWYLKNNDHSTNRLYIEVNQACSAFTSLVFSAEDYLLIDDIKAYRELHVPLQSNDVYAFQAEQTQFSYQDAEHKYLVMAATISKRDSAIDFIYLYQLDDYLSKVNTQRFHYFMIWLGAILLLYVFSYFFTGQLLKPIIQNNNKQKQFIALASHELRSPLAVFKTGISILKNRPPIDKAEHFSNMMNDEVLRMERLVSDLLFLSKAEEAALGYQFADVDIPQLMKSVYEKYTSIATKKQLELNLTINGFQSCNCRCDEQRITQAIIILLDNAIFYTPAGHQITLNFYANRQKCSIEVIDTGIGVADDEKDKIFDRFYQTDKSHGDKQHFGLGLSIAQEICTAHHGKISVTDTPGGGSTFTIKLPR